VEGERSRSQLSPLVAGLVARAVSAAEGYGREAEGQRADERELVAGLRARIAELETEVAELRGRVRLSSRNSSRPPSSDGYAKPPASSTRSLRRRSGRRPGGQPGSEGHHLAQVEVPDAVVPHEPGRCGGCGGGLEDAELVSVERRQVFDLPAAVGLEVCEHRALRRRCRGCGQTSVGVFPDGVGAPAQYGPRLRALVCYLAVYQHLPYERIARLLADCYAASLSTGTLQAVVAQGAAGLEPFLEQTRGQLAGSDVVHFDETGARAAGRLHWVHEASSQTLTLYGLHARRGREGIDALGVLPDFVGVAVHDGFAPYRAYTGCAHALCNGHHLRELAGVGEQGGQAWAEELACLLLELKGAVGQAKAAGERALASHTLVGYHARYRKLVAAGLAGNPEPARTGKRGRPRQGKARSLLLRLDRYQDDVLRFAHDFAVPFDNNQAERDVRMVKLQQKISGCWRSREGAEAFLALRSYISTARKQGQGVLAVLQAAVRGEPWLPAAGET
jgi:transposase